ncbi:MAG TPA: alpha-ketoglutarate-dependent dioxygenase AlkB [Puia sp.]
MENILDRGGEAFYFPEFFLAEESDRYFQELLREIAWNQEPVKIFGKMLMQPRLTAWYGDPGKPYRYSGITMHPKNWTTPLLEIKQRIEKRSPALFNSALLNLYRDQKDHVGWHRDNEKSLGAQPVIGSVSFGATRRFLFRYYADKKIKRPLELTHGSFLLMQGQTQHFWEHCIPKQALAAGPRINITFRNIQEPV